MHARRRPVSGKQRRVRRRVVNADSDTLFSLLTGPRLLERVEALLPQHRERLFPPTQTLSMFVAQALSADGSCRQVVNAALVKRVIVDLEPGSTDTGGYCKVRVELPRSRILCCIQHKMREIRPSGMRGALAETWAMVGAKRARKAETPTQPSLSLRLRAPYFDPTPLRSIPVFPALTGHPYASM